MPPVSKSIISTSIFTYNRQGKENYPFVENLKMLCWKKIDNACCLMIMSACAGKKFTNKKCVK